jgi:hypothetical protein
VTFIFRSGAAPEEKPSECVRADNGESRRTIGRCEGCRVILPLPWAGRGVGDAVAIELMLQ